MQGRQQKKKCGKKIANLIFWLFYALHWQVWKCMKYRNTSKSSRITSSGTQCTEQIQFNNLHVFTHWSCYATVTPLSVPHAFMLHMSYRGTERPGSQPQFGRSTHLTYILYSSWQLITWHFFDSARTSTVQGPVKGPSKAKELVARCQPNGSMDKRPPDSAALAQPWSHL